MLYARANKHLATKDLKEIIEMANDLIKRTENLPEEGTEEYEDLVRGYRERIHDVKADLKDVFFFGSSITNEKWYERAAK